jgi:hypothetical protein
MTGGLVPRLAQLRGRAMPDRAWATWKIWRIERRRRTVTVLWGPVALERRWVVPKGWLRTESFRLSSEAAARAFEAARVASKLRYGHERRPRRRKATRA